MFHPLSFDFWLAGLYGDSVIDLLEHAGDVPPVTFMCLEVVPVPYDYRPWPEITVS